MVRQKLRRSIEHSASLVQHGRIALEHVWRAGRELVNGGHSYNSNLLCQATHILCDIRLVR